VLGLNISNEGTWDKINNFEPLRNEILNTNRHFNSLSLIGDTRKLYHLVRKGIKMYAEQARWSNKR
jgi:hypothetical protein